jgi:hypothetical protein
VSFQKIPENGCDINLRKIGLHLDKYTDFWKQCGSVEQVWHKWKGLLRQMKYLDSLAIRVSTTELPFRADGTRGLPCHETIECLYLHGDWPRGFILNFEMLPINLTKFTLTNTNLYRDPMPILERLKTLRILRLRSAYWGKQFKCSKSGFLSLQKLELRHLAGLKQWEIQDEAMPKLRHLEIRNCSSLSSLPELQKVPTLQYLYVFNHSRELHRRIQAEDKYKIEHISSVHIEK